MANGLPPPVSVTAAEVATGGPRAATLESVLVKVDNVTVSDIAPPVGAGDVAPTNEFIVDGGLYVNDFLYLTSPFPTVGQTYLSITGVLELRNNNSKLEPRSAADVVTGPPTLIALAPSLVFVREDAGTTLPSPLLVRLSNAAVGDTAVTVTAASPEVVVGDGGAITVLNGQTTAVVPLFGAQPTDGGTVALTATMGTDTRQAQVRVLGANDVPRLVTLTPMMASAFAGGRVTYTVTTDLPVAAPTDVTLAFVPNTVGVAPMTVTIPTDATSATFDVTVDAMAPGMSMGTLTATLGADMFSAVLTVTPTPMGSLVINEVDYDNAGTDNAEFIEIFNGTNGPVDLTGMTVQLINGSNSSVYDTILLTAVGTLNAGEYLVIGNATTIAGLPMGARGLQFPGTATQDRIQNGSPDGLRLLDAMGGVVDALSYEGSTTFMGSPIQEGTAPTTAIADANAGNVSVCRIPNGTDTNVNGTDFKVCSQFTKGAANVP
jgi:hypothetical protein